MRASHLERPPHPPPPMPVQMDLPNPPRMYAKPDSGNARPTSPQGVPAVAGCLVLEDQTASRLRFLASGIAYSYIVPAKVGRSDA